MFKKLITTLALTLGVVVAAPVASQATVQPYQAKVVGDSIRFTLTKPDATNPNATPYRDPQGPVSPATCPVGGLQLFSVPYTTGFFPGPPYQSGVAYTTGNHQSLYLTFTPCNTNPGDTIEVKILGTSVITTTGTYVNVSTDGWVTSVRNSYSPQQHLDLLVTDLNTNATATISVVPAL